MRGTPLNPSLIKSEKESFYSRKAPFAYVLCVLSFPRKLDSKPLKQNLELAYPITEVGEWINVAAVKDLFGNHFGLIENPIFDLKAVR